MSGLQDWLRFFHGTPSAYTKPDPDRLNPNALYGPALYLTDHPEVAGSYAISGRGHPVSYWMDQLSQVKAEITQGQDQLNRLAPGAPGRVWAEQQVSEAEQYLKVLEKHFQDIQPNVRAVDVPANLNLLDVSQPAMPSLIDRVRDQVSSFGDDFLDSLDQQVVDPNQPPTHEDVYRALGKVAGWDSDWPNLQLAALGYHGIKYQGGQRIPMLDSGGQPVTHTALAIFPEFLDKLRNGISGQMGGWVNPQGSGPNLPQVLKDPAAPTQDYSTQHIVPNLGMGPSIFSSFPGFFGPSITAPAPSFLPRGGYSPLPDWLKMASGLH